MTTRSNRGFTLVELMVVVAIIGVLAAIAVTGVRAYLASAKTSEAKQQVGAISRGAVAAFERESAGAEMLGNGATTKETTHALCGSAKPVPQKVPKAAKYQPSDANGQDFNSGSDTKGWKCLKFEISQPIYYRYTYVKGTSGLVGKKNPAKPNKNGFEAGAQGDLDGDGVRSTFALTGRVNKKTNKLQTSTQIYIDNEGE